MDAIELLTNEHRHIERVLDVLQRAIEHGRQGGPVPEVLFERAAHFLLSYVDGSHGAKEEELFQAITAQGLNMGEGMLAAMKSQHELGHELAEALREAAQAWQRGQATAEDVYAAAERYVRLHRGHTEVEESKLFPLCRRLLAGEGLERVRARFARIEGSNGPLADAAEAVELAFPLPGVRGGSRPQPWARR
jgi:hemerythrin-like domain-containing protein